LDDSESTSKRPNRKDAGEVFPSGNNCILALPDCELAVETVPFTVNPRKSTDSQPVVRFRC